MIAESVVTGGVLAVALGAIELAKVSLAKRRNGSVDVAGMLKMQDENMRDLVKETRDQGLTLIKILTIIKMERGKR